ncbi:MAG: hypothetical protein M1826_005964 [Phylliscum demangeonii]|nr:MAG: hypothetical protein M1826_005964 [Phylliscum demangeonii]
MPPPNLPVTIGPLNGQTQTIVFGSSRGALPAPIILGSQTYTANSATQLVIEGQTLAIGSPITVGSGSSTAVLQLQATRPGPAPAIQTQIIVGSSSTAVQANGAPITIGDHTYTANSATQYVIEGHTLGIGAGITVGSGGGSSAVIQLQVATAGAPTTQVIIGRSRTAVQAANGSPIVAGDQTYSANSASQYIISGQTLGLGSPITVGSGASPTVIALQATTRLAISGPSRTAILTSGAPLVLDSHTYGVNSASGTPQYIIEGHTLGLGRTITLGAAGPSQTVLALQTASDGSGLTQVVYGAALDTITPSPTPAPPPSPPVLTIGQLAYTANAASNYVLAPGLTLSPAGSVVTLSGTLLSLGPAASFVVVGASTETLAAPPPPPTAAGVAPFTGAAAGRGLRGAGRASLGWYGGWLASVAVAAVLL